MSQGKGSKNNRVKNWFKYWDEHDYIFKKNEMITCFMTCEECGQCYKESDKNKYMKFEHGGWTCKQCNYN